MCGSPSSQAPEMRTDDFGPEYSTPVDVYSLGVMMAEAIVAVTSQVRASVCLAQLLLRP